MRFGTRAPDSPPPISPEQSIMSILLGPYLAKSKSGTGVIREWAAALRDGSEMAAGLSMEAALHMGLVSCFASGYLNSEISATEYGATHTWAEVYLPGAGWRVFDPVVGRLVDTGHTGEFVDSTGCLPSTGGARRCRFDARRVWPVDGLLPRFLRPRNQRFAAALGIAVRLQPPRRRPARPV